MDPIDRDCLVSVCLNCGSIAVAPDRESRDVITRHYDTSCCDTTVAFHSKES
jgi:hypothetical protein